MVPSFIKVNLETYERGEIITGKLNFIFFALLYINHLKEISFTLPKPIKIFLHFF